MLRVGIVAGEASGDVLGSELIHECKKISPGIQFEGIGGPLMASAGCDILFPADKLAVMGILEVAGRYFELASIRRKLLRHYLSNPPDLFIGIDAPDFNLTLEKKLRHIGVKTVHYVGPTVWAWRAGRLKKVKQAVDLMLVLFPFEVPIYENYGVKVKFAGHPAVDSHVPMEDKSDLNQRLGIDPHKQVIAFMPGSRKTEIDRILPIQLEVFRQINKNNPDYEFITNVLTDEDFGRVEQYASKVLGDGSKVNIKIFKNRSKEVLSVADVGLLTSGTITLEALLCQLPMVVMYKMNSLSFKIIRSMVRIQYASLPNLLAGKKIVPEFIQDDCIPDNIKPALLGLLKKDLRQIQLDEFKTVQCQLKQLDRAALAREVLDLVS
ncbi:MAG: lipid-A-disaccharide synthase [Gammaproteobacteria bacterium]|nr:lipid-A-disaccharide synthase [Gammaproteobacteria bacterium]